MLKISTLTDAELSAAIEAGQTHLRSLFHDPRRMRLDQSIEMLFMIGDDRLDEVDRCCYVEFWNWSDVGVPTAIEIRNHIAAATKQHEKTATHLSLGGSISDQDGEGTGDWWNFDIEIDVNPKSNQEKK